MQGIFSLLLSFESITNPALQRQLLQHSLDLLELSRESAVQLLSHKAESAGKLMGLLREHAPVFLRMITFSCCEALSKTWYRKLPCIQKGLWQP